MNWTSSTVKRLLFTVLMAACLVPSGTGGPLFVRNNSPVYLWFATPPIQSFDFYNGSKWNGSVLSQYDSMYAISTIDQPDLEPVFELDMETLSVTARLERRLNAYSSVSISIPVITHWKGMFDSLIENYHDIVGFNNGGRELRPDNTFAFRFGELDLDGPEAGLGDVQLGLTIFKVGDITTTRFALTLFCKLPTGSVRSGLGSGSVDFGAQAAVSRVFQRVSVDAGFGFIVTGSVDKRLAVQADDMGFGYVALSLQVTDGVEAVGQLLLSSSPYHTGYDRLDDAQAMLTLGIRWRDWEVSFSEDVFTYTAPDITLSVNRKFRF